MGEQTGFRVGRSSEPVGARSAAERPRGSRPNQPHPGTLFHGHPRTLGIPGTPGKVWSRREQRLLVHGRKEKKPIEVIRRGNVWEHDGGKVRSVLRT